MSWAELIHGKPQTYHKFSLVESYQKIPSLV